METFLIYLIKVSGVLAIFYLAYQLFLKRETFFSINRHFLLAGILTAIFLPFVSITNYVEITATPLNSVIDDTTLVKADTVVQGFNWIALLFTIYLIGLLIFTIKFFVQIISLLKLVKNNKVYKQGKFYHVETHKNIAPFSFFNYIFYNPALYSSSELSAIIEHERAHSSQWHSLDVLFSHCIAIITWMNPFSWLYQNNMKQNLEFLADDYATKEVPSIKKYQYTLLKVSGNQFCPPIVNNFFNSLIKKRIVMLNKSKSNKRNILKIALILPALAVFLVSFNRKDVYIPIDPYMDAPLNTGVLSQIIEIKIDKNTTDKELKDIKKDLAKKGVDFSYTVVHNAKNEITDISIDFATTKDDGKKIRSSSSFSNGDEGIDPIHIIYDEETNSISMGDEKHMHKSIHKNILVHVDEDSDKTVWVHVNSDGDDDNLKTIEIIDEDGVETIKINGKKVSRGEYEAMKDEDGVHKKHIKIKKIEGGKGDSKSNVFIFKDSDDDEDMDIEVISEEGNGFFFINHDGDEKPLYFVDGKETTKDDIKFLEPSEIKTMNVLKGEKAEDKYGKKGKNGVIEITTKKE
ncbi:MAG: M56 family peptidase [Maribacter sp.]|nr:M56 family peptidase [Maribacter sp.]